MNTPSHLGRILPRLSCLLLLAPLSAQWATLPYNSALTLDAESWYVAHDTPGGIQACSAIAGVFQPVGAPGSTIVHTGDSVLVVEEPGNVLRGWSALYADSATQTCSASHGSLVSMHQGTNYAIFIDNVPSTNGVLRAYSAFTNTWSSLALPSTPTTSLIWGNTAAVQKEGLNFHAYSAYTGQWVTLTVATAGGAPFKGVDYVAVDLHGSSGPLQYAAFSAPRGSWSTSPAYLSTGAGLVSSPTSGTCAIKVPDPTPSSFRYAGYSPYTGQWATSGLLHTSGSTVTTAARATLVRVLDSNVAARVEVFGAVSGAWQSLTGANYSELYTVDNAVVMQSPTVSPATVYFASGFRPGWISLTVPGTLPNVAVGTYGAVVVGGATTPTAQAWGWSAGLHAIAGPVAFPTASGYSIDVSGGALGINVQGAYATGAVAHAYSTRWGSWVDGPALTSASSWDSVGSGTAIGLQFTNGAGSNFTAFDEHANTWQTTAHVSGPHSFGPNAFLHRPAVGTWEAFSSPRGTWSQISGVGTIVTGGGLPTPTQNLTWFADASTLYVFCAPDATQAWAPFPAAPMVSLSGSVGGGPVSAVGVSLRGHAGVDFALVYAAFALAPAPLSVPGFGGLVDLDPLGAFLLAAPGLVPAGGVAAAAIPVPSPPPVPPGLQVWMQGVLVDLSNFGIQVAGRATGTQFF